MPFMGVNGVLWVRDGELRIGGRITSVVWVADGLAVVHWEGGVVRSTQGPTARTKYMPRLGLGSATSPLRALRRT